jgi:hypothetical protein
LDNKEERNENEAACTETQFICLEMRKTNAHKKIATLYYIIRIIIAT